MSRIWTNKKWITCMILSIILLFPNQAYADSPYTGYTWNQLGNDIHSINGYLYLDSIDGSDLPSGLFKEPEDLFIDENDFLYIVDSGNNRVVLLDNDLELVRTFGDADGPGQLSGPKGVYVTEEGTVYVADTNNERIAIFLSNGTYERELTAPQSTLLGANFVYSPSKLLVDKRDYLFVASNGTTNGLLQIDQNGNFESFFGSNRVSFSWARVFLRLFASQEQQQQIIAERPLEISNVVQDDEGFIYTTTLGAEMNQLKRLSPVGVDTLNRVPKRYGDRYDVGPFSVPTFIDLTVNDHGVITILDQNTNKAFQYDELGNLLFAFGGTGEQNGLFKAAVSIDQTSDGTFFVVDKTRSRIDRFRTTPFGELVHQASRLYVDGRYEEAESIWQEVLALNSNYDLAYNAIGKALYKAEEYEEAMEYFQLARNKWDYSTSFRDFRREYVREYFEYFAIGLILLFILLRFIFPRCIRYIRQVIRNRTHTVKHHSNVVEEGEPK